MNTVQDSSLQWLAGTSKAKDWIVLAGVLNIAPDAEFTRAYVLKSGQWGYFDLPGVRVRSIYANPGETPGVYLLGRRGQVVVATKGRTNIEEIPDAETFGYLNQIRSIANKLYICGYGGQVYRRDSSGWRHIDEGLLEAPESKAHIDLASIDGTSQSDIYVVGNKGTVAHFNGESWTRFDAHIGLYLTWVRCLPSGEVYICGFKGTLLKYSRGRWEMLTTPLQKDDFWCIECFQNKIYVASLTQVFVLNGKELQPTDAATTTPEPDAFRLDARDGVLWSFGERYVCFFDGKTWTYVEHPDNP